MFRERKIETLLSQYTKGSVGFKQLSKLSGLSFNETSILLQKKAIKPPISELIDDHTSHIRENIKNEDIFKIGRSYVRKSREFDTNSLED